MYWLITAFKIAPFAVAFAIGWAISGWKGDHELNKFKMAQYEKEKVAHVLAAKVRKEKDRELEIISNRLNTALVELRNRPTRTELSSHGQNGTGSALSAEDAEFLVREAARADKIRAGLAACYKQYDEVTK